MLVTFDGQPYEVIFGSDIEWGGVYLELRDLSHGDPVAVLDAFYWDTDGRLTFSAYREDVPLHIVEWFAAEARRRLPPTVATDPPPPTPPSRPAG